MENTNSVNGKVNLLIKILLFWYTFIFISTEVCSFFHILNRASILISNSIFLFICLGVLRKNAKTLLNINWFKFNSFKVILLLLFLTFLQGFISAPSTTDSMVYHIPRIMYWMQEKTVFQDVIRNNHDFMPPFAEFILLHLYQILGNDRLLFFSQWLAYATSIYLSGLISIKIRMKDKTVRYTQLIIATLPIAVLQASSTQTDMVTAVFVLISLYLALCILEKFSFENLFLFGVALGLGSLVKSSFYIFSIIPLGILAIELIKKRLFLKIFLISTSLVIALIIQIPFFTQNLRLYGSVFGTRLIEQNSVYSNEIIGLNVTISNIIRNIFIQIPSPFINSYLEDGIVQVHKFLNLPLNDSRTTFENSAFHVQQIIFPQEDIAGSPLHLLLIFSACFYLIIYIRKKGKESLLFGLSILSFIVFSALFKWQQQHPRLEIPFLIIGTISSMNILNLRIIERKIFKFLLYLSVVLALIFTISNTSHPYFSYSIIYKYVQRFAPPFSSVPEAFYIQPRTSQYFNSRYYWFVPYDKVIGNLSLTEKMKLNFSLKDGFEYPFWVILNNTNEQYYIVPESEVDDYTIIISTTETPGYRKGYNSVCFETPVKYGFACVLRKII